MRHYVRITREETYNNGPMANPVAGTDQIYIDYGTNPPGIRQNLTVWNHQSVVPSRGITNRLTGSDQYTVAGSLTTVLFHEQAPFWEKAVFEPTVDAITKVESLPSYTIDQAIQSSNGTMWTDRFTGCMFRQATISGSNEGTRAPITLSVEVVGSTRAAVPGSPAFNPASCSDLPVKPYRWSKSELHFNNVTLNPILRSWTLTIAHSIASRINMGQTVTALKHTGWNPSLSITSDIDNWDLKTAYLELLESFDKASKDSNYLELQDSTSTGKLRFDFYNMIVSSFNESLPVADFFTAQSSLMPYYDCTNLDMTCTYTAGTTNP